MKQIVITMAFVGLFSVHSFAADIEKERKHDEMQTQKIAEAKAKIEEERIKFLKQYYPDMNISK